MKIRNSINEQELYLVECVNRGLPAFHHKINSLLDLNSDQWLKLSVHFLNTGQIANYQLARNLGLDLRAGKDF